MEDQNTEQQPSHEISPPVTESISAVSPSADKESEISLSEPSPSSAQQGPEIESHPQTQPEARNENSENVRESATVCEILEAESDQYSTADEKFEKELKALESTTPPNRRSASRRKSSVEKQCGKKAFSKQQMGNCAGSFAADCAAVCCCPCVLAHILILAIVKVPVKAFRYVKRKARVERKKKTDDDDDASTDKKPRSFRAPWSLTATPHMSGHLEGSHSGKIEEEKEEVDTEKFWLELYAAGHMGFGDPRLERD